MSTPALDRAKRELGNAWTDEQAETIARDVVSAALHDPDGSLVQVAKSALILADNDGDTRGMSQAVSDAYERGAQAALDALRAAILGEA